MFVHFNTTLRRTTYDQCVIKLASTREGIAKQWLMCYDSLTMLTKTRKQKIIKETKIHDTDTGSPEVQIGILSKRIDELAAHLKKNKKDKHSRRGLLQLVANRQTHMIFLQKKDTKRFNALMKKLGLKKKA